LSYKTVNACDSIIRVHLTIHNTAKEAVEVTVCENAFPYSFAGQSFPTDGYYTVNLKTIHGCDSIIALHIHKRLIPQAPAEIFGPDKIGKEGDYVYYINQVDSFYPITQYEWSVPDGCTIKKTNREGDSIWVTIPDNMGLNEGDITVYAYNECGRSATTTKHIKTYIKCTIRVYPNPVITKGEVTIEFNDMVGKNIVRITDATGRILHQEEFDIKLTHEEIKLPIGDFASGEYFVRVQTKEMAILKKIVVLKEAAATK
ncbi:MAG: T9SS type A sorting domain-containing protein, partial [Bacteroidales bacterium]|nr:T9SS type A sorting domain-containing protein [Bacteroidales bacterium]